VLEGMCPREGAWASTPMVGNIMPSRTVTDIVLHRRPPMGMTQITWRCHQTTAVGNIEARLFLAGRRH